MEKLRLSYQSMVTPGTVYDYDVKTGALETLKTQEIPSGYDATQYVTERVSIAARDGTMVPVSIVMRKDRAEILKQAGIEGPGPLHLYAYGAYGYAIPPGFSTTRLSLVDRGFAYAIAHIRGGDDLGRRWYLQGKLFERTNTFNDFVDVGRGLIAKGLYRRGHGDGQRRFGGRRIDGGDHQSGSRPIRRDCRPRAVRRCAEHHAQRKTAADPGRMAGMGQPDHRQGGVCLYAVLFAL